MAKPEMNRAKVLARLTADGWVFLRHGAEHDLYVHPTRPGTVALPRRRTLTVGVARSIAKQASWP